MVKIVQKVYVAIFNILFMVKLINLLSKIYNQKLQMKVPQENSMSTLEVQKSQSYDNFYFSIEGNIGCGKSTLLKILCQKFPQAKWIEEPVLDWQNVGEKGFNILQNYYKQPKRWGFTFQMYAIHTRIQKLQQAQQRFPHKLKICERSILADKYVFAKLMKDLQYMDSCEYEVFKSLYSMYEKLGFVEKTKIIYLRCTPEKCLSRTKSRQRGQQSEIPLSYLQKIHQKHQQWIKEFDQDRILVLDTTQDFKMDQEKIQSMVKKLKEFINYV